MSKLRYIWIGIMFLYWGCAVKSPKFVTKDFPKEIVGLWKGDLKIFSRDGKETIIPMQLNIQKTASDSVLNWIITYDQQVPRNYLLIVKNKSKGLYQIDEQNSIIIPARLAGNELVSNYEVMGNHMTIIYELIQKDQLLFKVNMWKSNSGVTSGGEIVNGDTIPKVTSYLPLVYQIAILRRS